MSEGMTLDDAIGVIEDVFSSLLNFEQGAGDYPVIYAEGLAGRLQDIPSVLATAEAELARLREQAKLLDEANGEGREEE